MAANIITIINGDEATKRIGTSRDDLKVGDVVSCYSEDSALDTGYSWELPYKPETSSASLAVADNSCAFTVDYEGPYLVRLTVDPGSEFEDSQFLRLRSLTGFGSLRLVAAGEQLGDIAIPSDMTGAGWAKDQNFNLNSLVESLSSVSTSGRVLYVDANRGLSDSDDPNSDISGYGDFHSIQDAIDCAVGHITNPATVNEPWTIVIRPGLYTEVLSLSVGVDLVGGNDVVVQSPDPETPHTFAGGSLKEMSFQSGASASETPIISVVGDVVFDNVEIIRTSNVVTQGMCVKVQLNGHATFRSCEIGNPVSALKDTYAIGVTDESEVVLSDCYLYGAQGVVLHDGQSVAEITKSVIEANHISGSAVLSSGTVDISYSELNSQNDYALKVQPSENDPTGGGSTQVRFCKIANNYDYDFSMEVPEIKLVGVEFENSTVFDGDIDFSGDVDVQGYVGANAVQLSELEEQPNTESTVWADGSQNLFLDDQKLAFETDVQAVSEDVSEVDNRVDNLTETIAMLVAQVQTLEETVATLSGTGDSKLNFLHREVVEDVSYSCHDCDEYIGVRTQLGTDHVIELEEDAASGRRLYIVDETGLGRVLIRPISAQPDPTINGEVGDYVLENREGVHIVSGGQTDGAAVNWTVS